ncbi:CPBP family intramembrane metalloprotease [Bacillus luteolus]|uniref:CPBP family intramembrane metalloprotease n=1 Tax=Litchfieldia luteola TaxID=682179 RepID=A0ABR9QFB1_9BACI|nr:type II CAAX endopeptidase family protein [Cytobacillus luteolus]MBE4907181.1 CPBP family intramembrane metalloprotease [Cytobacillus luteolus]MBP1943348.1 membrane protease YdiL (CAAX protease family) [Cytobacillus luteolus]
MSEVIIEKEIQQEIIEEAKRKVEITWKSLILFLLCYLGMGLAVGLVIGIIQGVLGGNMLDTLFTGYNGLLIDAAMFFVVLLFFKKIRVSVMAGMTFKPFKERKTYVYMIASLLVFFATQYILVGVLKVDDPSGQTQTLNVAGASEGLLQTFLFFLAVTLVTPIKEEIIYRGIIHKFLSDRYHFLVGFLVSSIIFGVAHIGYPISATIMGMTFVGLYYLTRSLTVPIVVHIIWNIIASSSLFVN